MTQTTLYRHFDADGRLLYIGISLSALARLAQHDAGSHWSDDIAQVTHERFPTRQSALAAEKLAIRSENPIHNVIRFEKEDEWFDLLNCDDGITQDHHAVAAARLNQRPPTAYFAIDIAARLVGVPIITLQKMVRVPDGHVPRVKSDELRVLIERLARGRFDLEPPLVLQLHAANPNSIHFRPLVPGEERLVHAPVPSPTPVRS